jgi:phosphoribosyl-AMP cyclohydrolase / phosphoribosyl-ATP pyrophosphohydrolase
MKINYDPQTGLIPVIIQDSNTLQVLMLGYMNAEAFKKTEEEKKVTFFSRSKNRLWTKGESSGHYLIVNSIKLDCDQDTLLIKATAMGPTCHTGKNSCFEDEVSPRGFLYILEQIIANRISANEQNSYTNNLYHRGLNKVAQKVGEEAVELIIEAKDTNVHLFKNEAADLLFHLLVLFKMKNITLEDVEVILDLRSKKA